VGPWGPGPRPRLPDWATPEGWACWGMFQKERGDAREGGAESVAATARRCRWALASWPCWGPGRRRHRLHGTEGVGGPDGWGHRGLGVGGAALGPRRPAGRTDPLLLGRAWHALDMALLLALLLALGLPQVHMANRTRRQGTSPAGAVAGAGGFASTPAIATRMWRAAQESGGLGGRAGRGWTCAEGPQDGRAQ
jgi:hypothetical protein